MGKMAQVVAAVALAAISFGVSEARAQEKSQRPAQVSEEGRKVAEGGNEFAAKLYGQLKDGKGRFCSSGA